MLMELEYLPMSLTLEVSFFFFLAIIVAIVIFLPRIHVKKKDYFCIYREQSTSTFIESNPFVS